MTKPKAAPFFFCFPLSLLCLCLLFPAACRQGVSDGLDLTLHSALPALFPSLVLSRLIALSFPKNKAKRARALPLLAGLVCGFPVGAAMASDLVQKGMIPQKEAEKMLFFCNNTGPSFLILLCGKELFQNAMLGWFLFIAQSILSLLFYFLFFPKQKACDCVSAPTAPALSVSRMLTESLSSAISSFLYIASCILFFSFLISLLTQIFSLSSLPKSILSLFLELTAGVRSLILLPRNVGFPLCAAGVGFGGFSVHLQTLGVIEKASLSPKLYFLGKITFSLLLFLLAEIFQKCL